MKLIFNLYEGFEMFLDLSYELSITAITITLTDNIHITITTIFCIIHQLKQNVVKRQNN